MVCYHSISYFCLGSLIVVWNLTKRFNEHVMQFLIKISYFFPISCLYLHQNISDFYLQYSLLERYDCII